jgi:DNA mismatch endonuclease, patch repair protein
VADVLDPAQRRLCMSRNRGRDTKPEVLLRKACWAVGLRYVLNAKLVGRPDFVLPRYRVAVFVDGCFWHGCSTHYQAPAIRSEFWKAKIDRNRDRDSKVSALLVKDGWTVIRVWEHEIRQDLSRAVEVIRCAASEHREDEP